MKKKVYHLVARARRGLAPLTARAAAVELWQLLNKEFHSNTLACVLMPNHLHIALITANPGQARRKLGVCLRNFTRNTSPGRTLWSRQPPVPFPTQTEKLGRLIRYIHLNPCRAALTRDPWVWEFSTVREHSRIAFNRWVAEALIEEVIGKSTRTWAERHDQLLKVDTTVDLELLESNRSRERFDQLPRSQIELAITALFKRNPSALSSRGAARDLLGHALVSQETCEIAEHSLSVVKLAAELGMSRKRLGQMKRAPLTEKQKRIIARHSGLIHDSRGTRSAQLNQHEVIFRHE